MSDRFVEALAYAESLHRRQRRKGSGCPYLAHLMAVASLVMEAGGSEDESIAALLHDAVEDQGGSRTAAEIRRRFGREVAEIVAACSEDKALDWLERKLAAVRRTERCGASARLVLSADKLHNARSILVDLRRHGDGIWDRFTGGRDGSLWYYRAMADALGRAGGSPLLPDLEAALSELESLALQRRRG